MGCRNLTDNEPHHGQWPAFDMRSLIGVIDLKSGRAVHAIAGNRQAYRPVECMATAGTAAGDAIRLAQWYRQAGVGGLYVADLDAITGVGTNENLVAELAQQGLPLWLDAGIAAADQYSQPNSRAAPVRVVGTESLASVAQMSHLLGGWIDAKVTPVLSLDFRQGQLIGASPAMAQTDLELAVSEAQRVGVGSVIVLDLAAVGTGQGPATLAMVQRLRASFPELNIVSGGGVRNVFDAVALQQAGCERVLVGTALYQGREKFAFPARNC